MIIDTLGCDWGESMALIFSSNVFSPLIYYSHIFSSVVTLIIGIYILIKQPKNTLAFVFFLITLTFSIWVFSDLVLWADSDPSRIMFFWSLTVLFEPIIYALCLYFSILYLSKNIISIKNRITILTLLLPTLLLVPTKYAIIGFNYTNCDREVFEGPLVYYGYFIEIVFLLWIAIIITRTFARTPVGRRREIVVFGTGLILFLLTFTWGNIIGTLSDNWTLAQYGLFGMPVFIGFLAYNIVKFKLFNIKLIGANVLVLTLWILMGSLLAIQDINVSHAVTAITLIITIILGFILINSVRKEVNQRLRIEALAADLTVANNRLVELDKQKSEFVSFATHQLRAPLTAMKGYTSLILEGELGSMNDEIKKAVKRIFDSSNTLANIINDYLNISRIELGTLKYNFEIVDFRAVVSQVIDELKPSIDKKGLKFSFMGQVLDDNGYIENIGDSSNARFIVHADKEKIKQVITNLIDNALKYTPSGSIDVRIVRNIRDRKILFTIKDTGMGIAPEVMPKLFEKFIRSDRANKQNIYGTGLGLYLARQIMMSHKGRIWAESLGEGKGSTFFLELDMEV